MAGWAERPNVAIHARPKGIREWNQTQIVVFSNLSKHRFHFLNIFGRVGSETFARFMGLVLLPISIWATINGVLALLSIGVF